MIGGFVKGNKVKVNSLNLFIMMLLIFLIKAWLVQWSYNYIMPKFDNPKNWIPLFLFIWIYASIKDKENRMKLLILLPITILFCDQIGGFIKDFHLRDRPWFGLGVSYSIKNPWKESE